MLPERGVKQPVNALCTTVPHTTSASYAFRACCMGKRGARRKGSRQL